MFSILRFTVASESTSDAGPCSVEDCERETQISSLTAAQSQMEVSAENTTQQQRLCPCCTFSGSPSQPADVKGSKQAYEHASKVLKRSRSYHRCIQPAWYKRYTQITICTSSFKIFCHTC